MYTYEISGQLAPQKPVPQLPHYRPRAVGSSQIIQAHDLRVKRNWRSTLIFKHLHDHGKAFSKTRLFGLRQQGLPVHRLGPSNVATDAASESGNGRCPSPACITLDMACFISVHHYAKGMLELKRTQWCSKWFLWGKPPEDFQWILAW